MITINIPDSNDIDLYVDGEDTVLLVLPNPANYLENIAVSNITAQPVLANTDRFYFWRSGWFYLTWGNIVSALNTIKVNALGNISGNTSINLDNGTWVTATLTAPVSLTFTGLPPAGYIREFILYFTNIETITVPVTTLFAGGVAPVVITSPYIFTCSIDSAGVLTIHTMYDNIKVP